MDLQQRINALTSEVEILRARNYDLEQHLSATLVLPVEWRLTGSEATVFGCLVNRPIATKEAILTTLYSDRDEEAEIKIIDVFVCKLRKKLAPFGITIETIWGRGYRLQDEVRARYALKKAAA